MQALLPFLPSMVDWLTILGNNHSAMQNPTLFPITDGVVTGVGTGADEVLGLTIGDVVRAGVTVGAGAVADASAGAYACASAGTGSVDVDAGWLDGVIVGFVEPVVEGRAGTELEELVFPVGGTLERFWKSAAILSISCFRFWWWVLYQLLIWLSVSGSRPLSLMDAMHSKGSAPIPQLACQL